MALVLKRKFAPFGEGLTPPLIKLIGVNISRSCAKGDWTKSGWLNALIIFVLFACPNLPKKMFCLLCCSVKGIGC